MGEWIEIPAPADLVQDRAGNVQRDLACSLKLAGTATNVTHAADTDGTDQQTGGLFTLSDGGIGKTGARRYIESGQGAVELAVTMPNESVVTRLLQPISASVESGVAFVNAKKFGLLDGMSDTQVYNKLTEAIADVSDPDNPLGLFLPPRLDPTQAWTIDQPIKNLPSGLHWRGLRNRTRIRAGFSTDQSGMIESDFTNGSNDLTIEDLVLDRSVSHTQHGFKFYGCDRLRVRGCRSVGANTSELASGFIIVGAFGVTDETVRCDDVIIEDCWTVEGDNFGIQFGYVVGGKILRCGGWGQFRECIGIEPGATGRAQDILIHGCSVWGGTVKNAGSTSTGLVVVTETSGGTVDDVLISDCKVFGAKAYFDRFGEGAGSAAAIVGSVMPGFSVVGGSNVRLRDCFARETDGPAFAIGAAGTATAGVRMARCDAVSPNQGASSEDGTGRAAAVKFRNATDCRWDGGSISGTAHVNSIHESSSAARNRIENVDLGSKPLSLLAGAESRIVDPVVTTVADGVQRRDHAKRQRSTRQRVSVTFSGAGNVASLMDTAGGTTSYSGEVLVVARRDDTSGASTAVYKLLVGKHAASSGVTVIASNGLTAGSGATWPSFTWTVDTTNNKLVATPVGSTTGAFLFYLSAEGDIALAAP